MTGDLIGDTSYWDQFEPGGFAGLPAGSPTVDPAYPVDPGRGTITTDPYGSSATQTGTKTGATTAPASGGGMSAFDAAWMAETQYPGTVEGLKAFVAAHPEYGVTLGGSKGDKVYGPGGVYWGDYILSAGLNGGQGKITDHSTGGGGSAGGGGIGYGDWTQPYGGRYTPPTMADLAGFSDWLKPYGETFHLPSEADLHAMPGYQAGLDAAGKAVEHSAAARGTLLTGGTQQRLQQTAQDYENQQYNNLANLNFNAFNANKDTFYHDQDSPFAKYLGFAGLSQDAFNTNFDIFKRNQDAPFSKYLSLANLGR